MRDPLPGVYLRPLPEGEPPGRHSAGARRRALQLRSFLAPLHALAREELERGSPPPVAAVELLVVGPADWAGAFSVRYGLPFVRHVRGWEQVVMPADYPPRLLRRFDDALLSAARSGGQPPGELRELLDLLAGPFWGRALLAATGRGTRWRAVDDLLGTLLFVVGLERSGGRETLDRFAAWAEALSPLRGGVGEGRSSRLTPPERLAYEAALAEAALQVADGGWRLPRSARFLLGQAFPAGLPESGELGPAFETLDPRLGGLAGRLGAGQA